MGGGVGLELSYNPAGYHSLLRSLCQFVNECDFALEVALVDGKEEAWQMIPRDTSFSTAAQDEVGCPFEHRSHLIISGAEGSCAAGFA